MSMNEATSPQTTIKRLQDLSEAELAALADAVEAAKPLDYQYFRWTEHLRRYLLFYWALGLTPVMLWSASTMQDNASWATAIALITPMICWFASPRLAGASPDVRRNSRDIACVLILSARHLAPNSPWNAKEKIRTTMVQSYFFLRGIVPWFVTAAAGAYAVCHTTSIVMALAILIWCGFWQRYGGSAKQYYDIRSYINDDGEIFIDKEEKPWHEVLFSLFLTVLFLLTLRLPNGSSNGAYYHYVFLQTISVIAANFIVHFVPWGKETCFPASIALGIMCMTVCFIRNKYQKIKEHSIAAVVYKQITTLKGKNI
jgi:hypothetical protein